MQDIAKETTRDPVEEVVSAATEFETTEQISFNPNVFTEFKLAGSPQVRATASCFGQFCILFVDLDEVQK